jgi:hypothetical protein
VRGPVNRSFQVSLPAAILDLLPAREDTGAALDAIAGFDRDFPLGSEEDVNARAEFDETDAFACCDVIARLFIKDDAAGDQAGDLGEGDAGVAAVDCHRVAFVLRAGDFAAGDEELALRVVNFGDRAGDGGTVDVDVEDIQEDADAGGRFSLGWASERPDAYYFAVGGGDSHRTVGNWAFGVAKEVQAEQRDGEEGQAPPGLGEIPDYGASSGESDSVVDAVDDHPYSYCTEWQVLGARC